MLVCCGRFAPHHLTGAGWAVEFVVDPAVFIDRCDFFDKELATDERCCANDRRKPRRFALVSAIYRDPMKPLGSKFDMWAIEGEQLVAQD